MQFQVSEILICVRWRIALVVALRCDLRSNVHVTERCFMFVGRLLVSFRTMARV